MKQLFMAAAACVLLAACQNPTPSSDAKATSDQEKVTDEAYQQVGLPRITNFNEKKLATKIMEMRDNPNLVTYAYLQGMDGKLRCFGKGLGFGLPYGVQLTNPEKVVQNYSESYGTLPQSETNGLFPPSSVDATWYMLIDPKTGHAAPAYVEPHLTISTFPMNGPSVAEPCPE